MDCVIISINYLVALNCMLFTPLSVKFAKIHFRLSEIHCL